MANPFTPENKTGFVANSIKNTPAIPNKAGFFKDAVGEMARGVLNIEDSFAGLIEGGARALGFDEFAANQAQGRKNTFEQWDKDLTNEGVVHQTMLEGEDSLLNRYKRGEDWIQYAPEAVSDLVFQQLPQLAFGGVAGKLGAAGGTALKVAPKIGALGGMALGTGAQETGSIYNEQKEGEKNFGKAVATGIPAGLLETAGTMFGLKKSGIGKYIAEGLEEAPVKNWAGVGINLLKGGLGETATEGSQNVLEQIGRQPGWDIPKDISNIKPMEVAENALGGFIMGGGMSGIGSAVEMKQNAYMDARNKAQQDIANGEAAAQGVSDKFAADVSTGVQSASLIDGAETLDEQVRKQRDIAKQETIAGNTLAAVDQAHEELENFNAGIDELSKPSYLMPNGQPAYTGSLESEITGVNKTKTKLFSNHLGFVEKDLGITGLQIVDVKGDQSEVLQRIAQALGRKVHYYIHGNLQGEATAPEGFTNRNDPSRIFINARGSYSPIFIFGHEVAHTLASEMGGSSFRRLVGELEDKFDVERYNSIIADAKQQKEFADLTDDGIKEELVGNLFGEFLIKPHNLEALAAYNPTLFQKIAAIAIKVINKIKKAIGSLKGQYPTAASFVNDIGHVEAVIASVLNSQATIASLEGYEAKPYSKEDKLFYMKPVEDEQQYGDETAALKQIQNKTIEAKRGSVSNIEELKQRRLQENLYGDMEGKVDNGTLISYAKDGNVSAQAELDRRYINEAFLDWDNFQKDASIDELQYLADSIVRHDKYTGSEARKDFLLKVKGAITGRGLEQQKRSTRKLILGDETIAPEQPKQASRNIAVIGTAGRDKTRQYTLDMWKSMVSDAKNHVSKSDNLVSGGAAWADHLAVRLFLDGDVSKLTLHLPAPIKNGKFVGGYKTAGGIAQYYHDQFKKNTGVDGVAEIEEAIKRGAKATYQPEGSPVSAMFTRNKLVAKESDAALAYTFGEDDVDDGGTKNTWDQISSKDKKHRSIHKLGVVEQEEPTVSKADAPQIFSGKMTYDANTKGHEFAGENKRAEVKSTSTADAIRNGERTATTRYESQGNIDYWKKAKVGDFINFEDSKGKIVKVRITRPLFKLKGSGENAIMWSKKEGWSVSYFNKNIKPKLDEAWQLEYEYVGESEAKPATASSKQEPINVYYGTNENAHFSNLASRPFEIGGRKYLSVEHAYQSNKSGSFDQETYDKYKKAGVKIAGNKGTDTSKSIEIMGKLMFQSFKQNPEVAKRLIETGDAEFTHKQDKGIWGKEFPRLLKSVREALIYERDNPQDVSAKEPIPSQVAEDKKPSSGITEVPAAKPAANPIADITTKAKAEVYNKVYWKKVFGEIVPFEKFDEFAQYMKFDSFAELQEEYPKGMKIPYQDSMNFKEDAKKFMAAQKNYTRKRSYDADGNLLKDEYLETTPAKSKTAEERKVDRILDDFTKPFVTDVDTDPFEAARERRDLKTYGTKRQQEDELSDSEYSDTAVADTIGLLVKQMAEANDWDLGPSKQKSKRSIPQMDYIPKQIEKRNEVFRRRNTQSLEKIISSRRGKTTLSDEIKNARNKTVVNRVKVQDKTIMPERQRKDDVEKFKIIEDMINGIRGDWSTLESKRKAAEASFKRENETSIKMANKQIEESVLLDANMYSGEGAEYIKGVKQDLLDMIDTINQSGMYFPDVYKAVLKEQDIDSFSELIEIPQSMYLAFDQINNLSDIEEDAFTEEEAAKRRNEVSEKNKEQGVYYTKSEDTPVLKRQPVRQATDDEKEKIKAAAKNYVAGTTMRSKPVYEQWKASNATPEALKKIGKAIIEYVEEKRFDRQMTHYATDMIKEISEKLGVSERDVSNALRLMTVRVKDAAIPEGGEIKEEADYRVSNALEKNRQPKAIDNQDLFKPAQDTYHDLVRVLDLINGFGRQGVIEATFYDGEGGTYKKEISVSFAQRNANRRLERKNSSPQKGDIVKVKVPDQIKQAEVFASEMFGDYKQVNKLIDAATENEVNGKPSPLAQEDTEALKAIMQEIDAVKTELANSSSEITRLKKEQEAIVKKAKADANGAAIKMPTEFYKSKEALKKVEALPETTRERIAELEAKAKEHIIAIKTALFERQVDKLQGITPEFIEETAAKTGLTEQEVFEIAHASNYDAAVMTSQINRAVAIQRQEKFDAIQEGLNAIAKKNNGIVTSQDVQKILDKNGATAADILGLNNVTFEVKGTKGSTRDNFGYRIVSHEWTAASTPKTGIVKPSYTYDELIVKLGKIAEANHQAIQKGAAQKEQASDTKKVFGKLTIPKKIKNTDEKDDAVFEKANKPNVADPVFEEAGEATSFQEELVNTLSSLATQKRDAWLPVASHDIFVADKTQYEKAPLISGVESSDNYMVGRLRSGFAQSVFTKIANVFDADLVVVRDFSGKFNGMYIPKGKNGRAKLVINIDSKTSFTHLFAHELFHHIINRISASAANILQNAIDKSVDKSLYEKAKKRAFYDYTNLSDITKADQEMLQEEVNAEIFATAFKRPEFWDALSKTEEGKSVARRLIFRGLKNITSIMKVLNSLGRGEQSIFEIDKLVKEWYGNDGVYQALAKVVNEALDSNSPLRHNSIKYSAFEHGKVAANELKGYWQEAATKATSFFRRIFPKGTKSYKEVMQNIEDIAGESLAWIKKHKPAGIYEDIGADEIDIYLVSKVAFDPAWEVKKAEAAVEKYKEVWKGMTDLQLEKLHDAVVRKKDITGLTDEQKAAFEAYKEIADGIWERLSKIYPDLKKRESHYGQSIKWLFNNGIAMEKDINEEASRLLGNDRFTKEKADNKTTRQIAEEMNLKYETINPHELLMNYVYDSAKLIGLHEMLQEGMAQKKVFFLDENDAAAKRKGLRPVSDAAMKVMKDMTVSEGYILQKNGKDIVDDDSLEALKFDSLEEAQRHLEENPIEGARVVAKTSSKSVVDGKYYFTDRLGAMLETLVARDAVRNFEAFGISGHQVMNLKNKMTAVEMALSLFHAVTIGHEFNSSTFANQLQRGGSLLDKTKSLNIFANLNAAKQASKLMNMLADPDSNKEEIKEKLKKLLRTDSDEVLNVLEYYYRSGGEQSMDKDFQTSTHKKAKMKYGSWDEMKGSVKEVWDKEIANNPDKRFKAMFNAAEFAALEAPTAWLMEDGIPMLKLSLFGTEFVFEVGKKEKALGRKLTDQEKQKVAWDVMKFVGDRMGEVNWKTQFMLPNVKTALQFAMRSYTWVSGNIIALGKSGHAFTEYGWAKLKGDKDAKLSPYGYWGISAIFNHFLAASLITASYTLSRLALGYEEAPDDPETSLLTKAIFPRISAHDPTKRLAIPSYVTESYKILSHLGLTGHKAEPFKLISGRFNSLVSNLVDVLKNENWRGVNIRDKDENIVKQLTDVAAHMMVVPISFSTIAKEYKETGEIARPVATGIMGMTSAPASAIRSKATQRAFELRRSEYKGRETTEEVFEESQALKRAMYAYSKGDSSKIEQLKKEGRVSQRQYDIAITRIPLINGKPNPKYIDQLAQAIKGLTINGALEVLEEMSDAEKTKHKGEIKKKYFNMLSRKDKPEAEKAKIKAKMKELNLI